MSDIKWIKITTDMPDDEKILIIEGIPERDAILWIWVRLICLAGKVNDGGYIYINPELPYSDEQLAQVMRRPLNTVRLAIDTLCKLQMARRNENGIILLPNFQKHQNIEGMDRVRQLTAERVRRFRENEKAFKALQPKLLPEGSNVTKRYSNATDKNRLDKNRLDKNKECEESKNAFGKFKNVFLTENEHTLLKENIKGNYEELIEELSEAKASHGLEIHHDYAELLRFERTRQARELARKNKSADRARYSGGKVFMDGVAEEQA